MSRDDYPKVDHPNYDNTHDLGKRGIVVCFRVGYYLQPPAEAVAAAERIDAALKQIKPADLKLFREWSGSLSVYGMNSRTVNPDISDEQVAEFAAAAQAAHPTRAVKETWRNQSHGLMGVSVRMGLPV